MKLNNCFSNNKWFVNVSTVGEMIAELSRLPPDLQVRQGFSDSADIVVNNRDSALLGDPYVSVTDGGDWT